jgi:hypothetical protein
VHDWITIIVCCSGLLFREGYLQCIHASVILPKHVGACVEQQLNDLLQLNDIEFVFVLQSQKQWRVPILIDRVHRRPSFEQAVDEAVIINTGEVKRRVAGFSSRGNINA